MNIPFININKYHLPIIVIHMSTFEFLANPAVKEQMQI